MAQSGFTPISIYYSSTASNVPTAANLVQGELAINTNDGKLYYEDSSGVVQVLATKSTGSIGGSNTQVQFNNSGSLAGSANFIFNGTNVGIGVTPNANEFGNILQVNQTILNDDNAGTNHLTKNAYYNSGWKYISTDFASKYTQSSGTHQWSTAASGSANAAVTFTQALAVGLNTSLALQGATSQSGTGITFPATQSASSDANTLDDYEEGTWSPTDGSGAGLSLTVTNATYTKIGRMVYASAQVAYPVTVSSAQAILASLPFAVGTVPGTGVPNMPVTSSSLQLQINVKSINNAEIDIYPTAAGVTNAQLSGVAFISFTLIYPST